LHPALCRAHQESIAGVHVDKKNNDMSTQTVIFVGVGLYLVLMILIGVYAARGSGTMEDFVVSGRRMPLWLCSATLVATWFGAGPMIGSAGRAYDAGLLGVIADPFGSALVLFLVGFFFVRLFRRMRLLTVVDFFDSRFGRTSAVVTAIGLILSNIGWVAGMLVAFGIVFETMTGIPLEVGIICGAIVVFIYTAVGGMWAVALTDFVQMLIITVGLIVLLVVVLVDVGGWSAVATRLPEGTFRMVPTGATTAVWLDYIRMWLIFGLADLCAQTLLQRAMSARTEQVAQNSFYVAGVLYLTLGMIPVMLGIIGSVTLPGLDNSENVIPSLAIEYLHPVAIAIFVGALLAAIMSTTDSALLACASIFATNLLPALKPDVSDAVRLRAARLTIPFFGSIAVGVALYARVVYDLIVDANAIVLACVVAPFVAGVWWKGANRTGVLAGMALGFVTWIGAMILAPELPGDLLGLVASIIGLVVVTPLTRRRDAPRPIRDSRGNEVELTARLGVLPLFRRVDSIEGDGG